LSSRTPPDSATRRTRRAIGSSDGARLLASPAGFCRGREVLAAQHLEAGALIIFSRSLPRKIGQVARDVGAVQARPKQVCCQEAALGTCTPAAVRRKQFARRRQVRARVVECSITWKHSEAAKLRRANGGTRQIAG